MGKREDYTNCMKPYMTGGGPERKERFCIGAKVCSKNVSEQEAAKLCAEAAANPKTPKARKGRRFCTIRDMNAISMCVAHNIDHSKLTAGNMQSVISGALKKCVASDKKVAS